jgi:hypothetical protein
MKALSLRAPWWWYILYCGKDIENRTWPTNVRGRVYLHAGKTMPAVETREEMANAVRGNGLRPEQQPSWAELQAGAGCLVGSMEIVGCVTLGHPDSRSPWFMGRYGFVLRDPVAFAQPVPCRGALGFFDADAVDQARPRGEGNLQLF